MYTTIYIYRVVFSSEAIHSNESCPGARRSIWTAVRPKKHPNRLQSLPLYDAGMFANAFAFSPNDARVVGLLSKMYENFLQSLVQHL